MKAMRSRTTLVTVVVPVFNTREYLREALHSVSAQRTDLQLVIVDDGSTDGSAEVIDVWLREHPDTVLIRQANAGPGAGAARNVGLDAAKGSHILFLDSDDRLAPDGLDLLVREAQRTGDDLTVGASRAFPVERTWPWDEVLDSDGPARSVPIEAVPTLIHNAAPGNKLFRTEALRSRALRFAEGIHHQDTYVSVPAMLTSNRITVVPRHVHDYRIRPGSVMSAHFERTENFFDHLQVVEHLLRLRPQLGSERRAVLDAFLARSMQGFVLRGHQLPEHRAQEFFDRAQSVFSEVNLDALVSATRSSAHRRAYAAILAGDSRSWATSATASRVWAHEGALYGAPPEPTPDPLQRLGAVVATMDTAEPARLGVRLGGSVIIRGAAPPHLLGIRGILRLKGAGVSLPMHLAEEHDDPKTAIQEGSRWSADLDASTLEARRVLIRWVVETDTGQASTAVRWGMSDSAIDQPVADGVVSLEASDGVTVLRMRRHQ
jgi:glycosyltransferase involved in cell wall biosynthesis